MVQNTGNKNIDDFILLIFSFFLAFGLYDPFRTGGLYFDILTVLTLLGIYLYADKGKLFSKESIYTFLILLSIGIVFFFSSVLYQVSYTDNIPFDFKYLSAITIFLFLSYKFKYNKQLGNSCLLLFGISSGIIALGYVMGLFANQVEFRNDRLLIFGENPNSISSRMAIGFIILLSHIIRDPLKLGKIRFLLGVLLLPSLLFVIDTGSRGSFLILILATILLIFISNMKFLVKVGFGILLFVCGSYSLILLENTGLWNRFNADDVSGGREIIWSYVLDIVQNNPLGTGPEGYKIEMLKLSDTAKDPHNLFLYILVCGGLQSLILYLIFLYSLLKKAYLQFSLQNILPMILFVFLFFLMNKTGGIFTYLIMWYFLAYINSFSLNFKIANISNYKKFN